MESHVARRLMLNRLEATLITGATRKDVGAATVLIHPSLPSNSWNFAVDIDASQEEFAATIQRVEEVFREAKRWPAWLTGPYDRPTDFAERVKGMGYAPDPDRTVMWSDKPLSFEVRDHDGLEIERTDEATVDECIQIALQRFGWPYDWGKSLRKAALDGIARGDNHYRMYYATLDGAGVATAFMVFYAGTAGIYGMATSKDYEGKGIGRSILKHCLDEAFERGIDLLTLQVATGSRAEAFYERAGFQKAYVARKYGKGAGARAAQGAPAAAVTTA
jgi:ribosomal protein S18 acetylase RimI-like enzyme